MRKYQMNKMPELLACEFNHTNFLLFKQFSFTLQTHLKLNRDINLYKAL